MAKGKGMKSKSGQSIVEYLIIATVIVAAVGVASATISATLGSSVYGAADKKLEDSNLNTANDGDCLATGVGAAKAKCVQDDTNELIEEAVSTTRQ